MVRNRSIMVEQKAIDELKQIIAFWTLSEKYGSEKLTQGKVMEKLISEELENLKGEK